VSYNCEESFYAGHNQMGRRISSKSQQDKIERIARLQSAIATLETYQNFFEHQG
jgi:hypothetical protein